MNEVTAFLQTEVRTHPDVADAARLVALLGSLVAGSKRADKEWWMLVEHSNGYVVANKCEGDQREFLFAGTADLDPGLLFDGRLFTSGIEIRFANLQGLLTTWTHTALDNDLRVPPWVQDFVSPAEVCVLTKGPDGNYCCDESGLTLIRRGNGQRVVMPVPFAGADADIRLIVRRHFTWDDSTGRVLVAYEAPDRYERRT